MRSLLAKSALLLLFVLPGLILISCTVDTTPTQQTITPSETSPRTLTVTINITEDQNDLYPTLQIKMHFSSNQVTNPSPNTVDFKNRSKIICNGANLKFDGSNYTANVPTGTSGAYTCTYFWNGGVTVFPARQQTELLPTINGQGKLIAVNYSSNGGAGCQFKAEASDGTHSASGSSQADIGIVSGINVRSLSGPGTLVLTRTCSSKLFDAGFNEVDGTYTATSMLNVTWNA